VETTAAPVRVAADVERVISAMAAAPNGGMIVEPDIYTHAKRRHRARLLKRVDLRLERDDLDLLRVALDLESINDVVFLAEFDNLAGGLVH
jgi:hypothetical protein